MKIIFVLFLIAGIHAIATLKPLFIIKQLIIFYSPADELCLYDKSVQVKKFKYHNFIGMCPFFTCFNQLILNFC